MKWFKNNCRNKGGDGRTDERTDSPITIYHLLYSGGYNNNPLDKTRAVAEWQTLIPPLIEQVYIRARVSTK